MGSRSDRHVRFRSNQTSSSPSRELDTEPPLYSPPPYSYYDPNYRAERADPQSLQQEAEDRRRQRPEMVERRTFIERQQEDDGGRRRQCPEMEESQTFLGAQQEQMRRYGVNMKQQLRDQSIAEGIETGEYHFPDTRPLPGANNDQERLSRYSLAPHEAGPSNPSTTYNQGGIDTGEYCFSDTRSLGRANNDQETFLQYAHYEEGLSLRTSHDSEAFVHVDDATQIEEAVNTIYTQPTPAANFQSSDPALPEVRIVSDDPSLPFLEIKDEDPYSREKRYHIWRWARRVKKVQEGRDHKKWYKHARAFQYSFEKKTKDRKAKKEIMPWITHLGKAKDDFGRGL